MKKPIHSLSSFEELLNYISSNRIVLLNIRVDTPLLFNEKVKDRLEAHYPNQLNFASINDADIDYKSIGNYFLIITWLSELGLKSYSSLLSGYYLFIDGQIKGYHPDSLDLENLTERDYQFALTGAIVGFLRGAFTKNADKGFETFATISTMPHVSKIVKFFQERINSNYKSKYQRQSRYQKNKYHYQQEQRKVVKSELQKAYETVGLTPNATMHEIRKQKQKLALKYHPDRHPNEQEKYNKIFARINNAFDLIIKSRN